MHQHHAHMIIMQKCNLLRDFAEKMLVLGDRIATDFDHDYTTMISAKLIHQFGDLFNGRVVAHDGEPPCQELFLSINFSSARKTSSTANMSSCGCCNQPMCGPRGAVQAGLVSCDSKINVGAPTAAIRCSGPLSLPTTSVARRPKAPS